jgi:hypothetical protein
MKYLGIKISNKLSLANEITSILKSPYYCGDALPKLKRVNDLLNTLKDDISFVLEYPYVDRHFRDNYYSYHAAKFQKIGRNCIRVHIFQGLLENNESIITPDSFENKVYWGFFIIRPLPQYPLGRSLISPEALNTHNLVCCLMQEKVSLLGKTIEANGFPHVTQDTETHTCAESSLWALMEYFGSKYSHHRTLLPSDIYQKLVDVSDHRLLPSTGLSDYELGKCLQATGFHCLTYKLASDSNENKEDETEFFYLKLYIESGIPLILILRNKIAGHALLAIGHENEYGPSVPDNETWIDVSKFNKKIITIDDNMPPYQNTDITNPAIHYPNIKLKDLKIKSFIVPLPAHMFLAAEKAYLLIKFILNDPDVGLKIYGGKWLTRLFLTHSHSLKRFILNDKLLDNNIKNYLLRLSLPRFVWICEIYKENEFKQNICSGLILIDATSNSQNFASILCYAIDDKIAGHNGVGWSEIIPIKQPFRMCTYRNNLKGDWNQWQSN